MSALMSIGKTAMFASYAALQTTSNNISNANTVGYSRQQTQLADAAGQFTGSGFFGKGVDVTTVTRAYDKYLTTQAMGTASLAAADTARVDKLTQLENVFPIGSAGIGYAAGEFLNSFVDLSKAKREKGSEWMWRSISGLAWGLNPELFVPRDEYDGIVFIDTVHVPVYLQY